MGNLFSCYLCCWGWQTPEDYYKCERCGKNIHIDAFELVIVPRDNEDDEIICSEKCKSKTDQLLLDKEKELSI